MPFAATWIDLEIVILNELNSDKDKYRMILLICRILKKGTNELKRETVMAVENKLMVTSEQEGKRDKLEGWN